MKHLYTRILLYVIGLDLLIVGVLVGIFAAVRWHHRTHLANHVARLARHLATEIRTAADRSPGSRDRRLAVLARTLELRATLRDARGAVVSSWGEPLPRPLPGEVGAPSLRHLQQGEGRAFVTAVPYAGGGTLSVALPSPLRSHRVEGVMIFAGIGLLLSLLLVPLARYITRPLRELEAAARGIAAGDLTRRAEVRTKDEIGSLARAFNHMADHVATSIRQEKELVAGVSHELRAPLSRLRLAAELLAEASGASDPARRQAQAIAREVEDLDGLIEQLLTHARLESAAFPFEQQECNLAELVRQVVSGARRWAAGDQGADRIDLTLPDAPVPVRGSRVLLSRAVANLVENALQYSSPDSRVRVVLTSDEVRATLEVEDRGMGIPADELPRIFDPFFRGERSRSRRTGGVGIGLSLARQILRRHQGEVAVESEVGHGTRITVRLPLDAERDTPPRHGT